MDLNEVKGKPYFRLVVVFAVLAIAGFAQYQWNIIPIRASKESTVPLAVELPHSDSAGPVAKKAAALVVPTSQPTKLAGGSVRAYWYAWTALHGVLYANGGAKTTVGSLMEKHGVKLQIVSQPDLEKSKTAQITFAERLKAGDSNPAEGATFVITMGDGGAQYLASINKALLKLGPDYKAEVVGAVGYSGNTVSGEDACMGPPEWQDDPQKMKGALIAGYLRDGDWNLCLAYQNANGLLNNPDERTYDPDAVNWLSTDDYLKAAEAYIIGTCEDRKVVHGGKITNEKVRVCVNGVATWTPGDVDIAKKKGGLVKLYSTKESLFQMPAVVIGIHKWNEAHSKLVTGFLKASFDAADQIRTFDEAVAKAGKIAYEIYGEQSASYWVKYYKGVVEPDAKGRRVPLGGSRVIGFADNLFLFGLTENGGGLEGSAWKATYEGFGKVARQQYPKLVPDFPSVADATNTSFLQAILQSDGVKGEAETPSYVAGAITEKVAERNWSIQFDTGKATFTPSALRTLDDLYSSLAINNLSIKIDGHTDNVGSSALNIDLSDRRAQAVKHYLVSRSSALFPEARIDTKGYGDGRPVASNLTEGGRAENRRVTVTIGNK